MSLGVQAGTALGIYLKRTVVWTFNITLGGSLDPLVCLARKLSWLISDVDLLAFFPFIFIFLYEFDVDFQSWYPLTFLAPNGKVPLPLLPSGLVTRHRRVSTCLSEEGFPYQHRRGLLTEIPRGGPSLGWLVGSYSRNDTFGIGNPDTTPSGSVYWIVSARGSALLSYQEFCLKHGK